MLFVSTAQAAAGKEVSALVGASILNLVDAVIREQGSLPPEQRRGALVVVDEMQALPGVDYESMLSELGKFGGSFVLATQSLLRLSELSPTLRDTLLANAGCLAVFQVAAADARELVWELSKERLSEEDITSLPVHHAYVRATVGGERQPPFSMEVMAPGPGDPAVAAARGAGDGSPPRGDAHRLDAALAAYHQRSAPAGAGRGAEGAGTAPCVSCLRALAPRAAGAPRRRRGRLPARHGALGRGRDRALPLVSRPPARRRDRARGRAHARGDPAGRDGGEDRVQRAHRAARAGRQPRRGAAAGVAGAGPGRGAAALLARLPGPAFLALETEAARADGRAAVWRAASSPARLGLRAALRLRAFAGARWAHCAYAGARSSLAMRTRL